MYSNRPLMRRQTSHRRSAPSRVSSRMGYLTEMWPQVSLRHLGCSSLCWAIPSACTVLPWLQDGCHKRQALHAHTPVSKSGEAAVSYFCISFLKAEVLPHMPLTWLPLLSHCQIWTTVLNCGTRKENSASSPSDGLRPGTQRLHEFGWEKIISLFLLTSNSKLTCPLNVNVSQKSQ